MEETKEKKETQGGTVKTINLPGSPLHAQQVRLGQELSPGHFHAVVLTGPCKGDELGVSLDQCA